MIESLQESFLKMQHPCYSQVHRSFDSGKQLRSKRGTEMKPARKADAASGALLRYDAALACIWLQIYKPL